MTPAERLRAAATRLREVAGAATPGPWFLDKGGDTGVYTAPRPSPASQDIAWSHSPDVEAYIALMHPPVALALADWLDDLAAGWPWDDDGTCVWDDGTPMRLEESPDTHALAVADAVLGGEQR